MTSQVNWAGNVSYGAERIERPGSLDELQELVAAARTGGHRVHALGSRHSFSRIADTDGVLIETAGLPALIEVTDDGRAVRVSAGIRYGELAPTLHRRGLGLANLASLPHISVAGAVATGTHGSGNRIGSLASAVRAVRILTAGGEQTLRRGTPDFDGAVVNLGALGIVTELELDVEPTYQVAQTVYEGPGWDALLAEFDRATSLGTSVSVFTRWTSTTRADQLWVKNRTDRAPSDPELLERLGARAATVKWHPILGVAAQACTEQLGVPGPWHDRLAHFRLEFTPSAGAELQSEYLVPRSEAVAAIEAVRGLADRISPLLLVSEIRTMAADRLWLSPAHGADTVGIHFTWRPEQDAVQALLPDLEAALPGSTRPHWGKLFTMDPAQVAGRYPRWADFAGLRDRLDPDGLFRNGFLERLGF